MDSYDLTYVLARHGQMAETKDQYEARKRREIEEFRQNVLERACRRGLVPVEVYEHGAGPIFFYPVRLGREDGTIKLRLHFYDGDMVAKTIHIDPALNGLEWMSIRESFVWKAWESLSGHKRMGFVAAVMGRARPGHEEQSDV